MCGILICYSSKEEFNLNDFKNSLELQKHRGPDHTGIERISDKLFFGHVRLSIYDLTKNSNQPMISDTSSNVLTFNGDLYNYIELKENLKNKGVNFFSSGDTEVLLKYVEHYGVNGIKDFNGKWAFCIYDKKSNDLVISRDTIGKQPLYYYKDDHTIIISSEIKSIFHLLKKKRILRKKYINAFLKYGYIPNDTEDTIYFDINRFPPGETAIINLDQDNFKFKRISNNKIKNYLTNTTNLSFDELLYDSIKIRLDADVKVATAISGGVDSTLIASIVNKIDKNHTFVSADMGRGNDLYFSKMLAKDLGVDLEIVKLNYEHDIINRIEEMTKIFEIPLSLYGQVVAMNILYEKISKLGITVLMTGFGGDEIYTGYFDRYTQHFINSLIKKRKFNELFKHIFHSIKNKQVTMKEFLKYIVQNFGHNFFNMNFKNKLFRYIKLDHSLHPTKKDKIFMSIEDYQLWDNELGSLQSGLSISDSNAVMNSVSTRAPLLDFRQIYNIANPLKLKFYEGFNKYLLRNKIPKNVSNEIKWRREKSPFRWFGDEILFNKYSQLIRDEILKSKIINYLYKQQDIEKIYKMTNIQKYKELFLRCYAIALLDKVYDCDIK